MSEAVDKIKFALQIVAVAVIFALMMTGLYCILEGCK
jgi:hypothetical protein